jgi:3-phosphoshikimate 1-carboxyvinyltransferase
MQKRPISGLVDALINLGTEIKYLEKDNHLPIQIIGGNITKSKVAISAQISSQYISALLLIAPSLPNGLQIDLKGKIVSRPYIEMTLSILRQLGVDCLWRENRIVVSYKSIKSMSFLIENDWSAASYWYSIAALSKNSRIELLGLDTESMQGDAALVTIFRQLGVHTEFTKRGIIIKNTFIKSDHLKINFLDFPDLAPTIITTACALGITGTYTGLDTLEKKESKRIDALKRELSKIGAIVETNLQNTIEIKEINTVLNNNVLFETYGDHRMAMAFAPLVTMMSSIEISNPKVVEKSYPGFWNELKKAGIRIDEINEV